MSRTPGKSIFATALPRAATREFIAISMESPNSATTHPSPAVRILGYFFSSNLRSPPWLEMQHPSYWNSFRMPVKELKPIQAVNTTITQPSRVIHIGWT